MAQPGSPMPPPGPPPMAPAPVVPAAAPAGIVVPVVAAPAGRIPVFALHPALLAGAMTFIDYGTVEGRKAYDKAIDPLDPPFDGKPEGLQMFLHQVQRKARICGWTDTIMHIPTVSHPTGLSLISHYGQITLGEIETQARTYVGKQNRSEQDASNFKLFLDGSLGNDLMMRVLAQNEKYTFHIAGRNTENGPAMFRVILGIVGIETKATIAVINATLRTLPQKLHEFKHNITTFNEYVTNQCLELTRRGQEPNDLLYLLFEAYLTCKNKSFVDYIRDKESSVFDNSIVDMEPTHLMLIAEEKYKIMVIRGQWKETGKQNNLSDEHIVALKAAFNALTEQGNKKTAAGSSRASPSPNTGKWAWKDDPPKEGEAKFKIFQGKEYVHCPNHTTTKWVLASKHQNGCTLDTSWKFPTKVASGNEVKENPPKTTTNAKNLQYIKVLMSILSGEEDNEAEGDTDENV